MADEVSSTIDKQAVLDSRLIEKFEVHRDFTKVFLDGFVLVNSQRKILRFNAAFCTMLGQKAIEVRKVGTIEELFLTEIPGTPKSAIDLVLESSGPLRIDEVASHRLHDQGYMQLIIGSYPFLDEDGALLGACVVMRDVTAESNLQGKYKEKTIQSITDPLTGLFTRRYFEEWIDKELERCKRSDLKPIIGLLMFDLDKFKNINDTYGHQAGDFVLAETAKVLRENSRKSDILGRYGGEELLTLLVGSTPHGACVAAEKFRQAIQNHVYMFGENRIPVTASVGVSIFLSHKESRTDVVKRADTCLYAAKRGGRNVCYADFGEGEFKVADRLAAGDSDTSESTVVAPDPSR